MTSFAAIPGEILSISAQAQGVLSRAAAKRKATRSKAKPSTADTIHRKLIANQVKAGGSPFAHDWELVNELAETDPDLADAVDDWIARHTGR